MSDVHINIRIEGVSPLLCNRFTDAAQQAASSGTAVSTVGDRGTPKEIAEESLYKDEEGRPVIPQPNLYRCIIDAGTFFKAGKSKVTTQKSSMIPSCVTVDGVVIPLESREGWCIDTRPVRIPSTGGRILRHRAVFNDWALSFHASVDTTILSAKMFREIVDAAGKRIGLGDFRPACKGPFGKFVVTKWNIEEDPSD